MAELNKQTLEHLAKLARINLEAKEEEKLLADLKSILDYFEELKSVPTEIEARSKKQELGVFRSDGERENTNRGKGTDQFPENLGGLLKVPPVFE